MRSCLLLGSLYVLGGCNASAVDVPNTGVVHGDVEMIVGSAAGNFDRTSYYASVLLHSGTDACTSPMTAGPRQGQFLAFQFIGVDDDGSIEGPVVGEFVVNHLHNSDSIAEVSYADSAGSGVWTGATGKVQVIENSALGLRAAFDVWLEPIGEAAGRTAIHLTGSFDAAYCAPPDDPAR
jgi:hypothetical protein